MDELLTRTALTPDLSRTSPDLYRRRLFYLLDNSTRHGRAALDFATAKRNLSYDKIKFDPTRWQSRHNMEGSRLDEQVLY